MTEDMRAPWTLWKYLLKSYFNLLKSKCSSLIGMFKRGRLHRNWIPRRRHSAASLPLSALRSPRLLISGRLAAYPRRSAFCSLGLKCEHRADLWAHIKLCHAQTGRDGRRERYKVLQRNTCVRHKFKVCPCVYNPAFAHACDPVGITTHSLTSNET